ncbi:MAG TPA: lasso peptide isopeptide bond-forming cyclase [Chloroflexota bacterium]|nr:lasso peptide isopeptide bond-forming cyclase [Chloroflexota bacterium]
MGAVAGIFFFDRRTVARAELEAMRDRLAHRGPDGSGTWLAGSVGLAHLMLWTTPESLQEQLPLASADGSLVITADARVDNRDELIALLGLTDRPPRDIPDSQLILEAYRAWGERCPEKLLGDFAFVIWDARKQALFCARDHFGVRPLYYYASDRAFVFATEIKALFCLPEIPRRLNEVRIADYLVPQQYDNQSTLYQGILRLPPAHRLIVSRDRIALAPYWTLDPDREIRLKSDDEYAEGLREIFEETVRCRLRTAFPIGSMLSGGLDSSSITCMARILQTNGDCADRYSGPANADRWRTFSTIHSAVPESDEMPYIRTVLARGGFEPYFLDADQIGPLHDVDTVMWHQDEAIPAGQLYCTWSHYRVARERGVRVILDGFDGDTAISHGLGYFRELALAGRWLSLSLEVAPFAAKIGEPWADVLRSWYWTYGFAPLIQRHRILRGARRGMGLVWRHDQKDNRPRWDNVIRTDFKIRTGLDERRRQVLGTPPATEHAAHYRLLTHGGEPYALELLSRAGGAFSVEPRFPFRDKRLVEYCVALPARQKIRRGWTRMVMRRAMRGILPGEIQWRNGKTDLHPSFERGLRTFERERFEDVIFKDPTTIEPYIDVAALRDTYEKVMSHRATADDVNTVWRVVYLALWLRRTATADRSPVGRR